MRHMKSIYIIEYSWAKVFGKTGFHKHKRYPTELLFRGTYIPQQHIKIIPKNIRLFYYTLNRYINFLTQNPSSLQYHITMNYRTRNVLNITVSYDLHTIIKISRIKHLNSVEICMLYPMYNTLYSTFHTHTLLKIVYKETVWRV